MTQATMRGGARRRGLALAVGALIGLLVLVVFARATFAQTALRDFDHTKTGFPLTGQHTNERCESCHLGGIFKGTPRDCASCHVSGTRWSRTNVVKTQNHLPTQQPCEACHGTQSFSGAKFSHAGVAPRSCATCHNGNVASGKPADHMATTAACDSCHRSSAWRPAAGFDHSGAIAGTCATCHNGARATGRPATHVPVAGLAGATSCDACHKAGFSAWTPASVHTSLTITTQCATCHSGSFPPAVGKPATAIHANATVCETCHKSTSSWAGAKVDHSTFGAATNCASCHNGSAATGKSATHVPVGATNCAACHGTSTWKPTSFNHTQVTVTNQCASCHSGAYPPADGRNATHIPYQTLTGVAITNCDTCHKAGYAAWTPAKFHASVTVSTQCASCHTGSYAPAVGKPATAIHAGATVCETCHKSTTNWSAAKVDHSTFTAATNCASCHNGSTATGKSATHVPVGATNCAACHGTNTWRPTTFNHTQVTVTNQCSTCHSGAYPPADGRNATHIPYQTLTGVAITNCDTCHKAGYAAWTPARFHASVSVSTQCATCHTGSYPPAVGKPATSVHAGVTVCESCHKGTTTWSGATFAHSAANAVGTGTCDNCHNGATAQGKPATHIPVTTGPTKCDSCHKSQASWSTSVTMNHSVVVASTCKSCHNGSYVAQGATGALAKPANHIPEATQLLNGAAMDCNACHRSTTVWTTLTMNHNGSQGGGAGWCKGCHLSGTSYAGSMDKKSLTHKTKTPPAIDCSESGCHRPLGNKGSTYVNWD